MIHNSKNGGFTPHLLWNSPRSPRRPGQKSKPSTKGAGFTILETLIGLALFLIIGGGVYFAYANILEVITRSRLNQVAVFIMEREIEIIRNMPYEDIGVQGGSPAGLIPPQKTVESGNLSFEV